MEKNNPISMTNESFNMLKGSSDFLNIVLNNINSAVLLLDKEMKLQAFNDALKNIFTSRKDENLLYERCGEAIGCAYQVEEKKECGTTSMCSNCELRIAALQSYMTEKEAYKEHFTREFFDHEMNKITKHLQFSTRIFRFNKEKYIIMLIEDITRYVELKLKLEQHN